MGGVELDMSPHHCPAGSVGEEGWRRGRDVSALWRRERSNTALLIQSREATFGLMGSLRTHPARRARERKRQSCDGEDTLPLQTGDAHASTLRAGWSTKWCVWMFRPSAFFQVTLLAVFYSLPVSLFPPRKFVGRVVVACKQAESRVSPQGHHAEAKTALPSRPPVECGGHRDAVPRNT